MSTVFIEQIQVKLSKEFRSHKLEIAFDNTFVVLADEIFRLLKQKREVQEQKSHKVHSQTTSKTILHVGSNGLIINQYHFEQDISQFLMINSESMIVSLVKQNFILVINLKNSKQRKIPFIFQDPRELQMFNFSDSKLICIKQSSQKTQDYSSKNEEKYNNIISLVYLDQQTFQVQFVQKIKNSGSDLVFKGNNHSLLCFKASNEKKVQAYSLLLVNLARQNGKFVSNIRKINIPKINADKRYSFKIWSFQRNQMFLVSKEMRKPLQIDLFNTLNGKVVGIGAKLFQKPDFREVVFFGNLICCRLFKGHPLSLYIKNMDEYNRMYFISSESKSILFSIKIDHWGSNFTMQPCQYDPSIILAKEQVVSKNAFKIKIIRSYKVQDFYMHLLLHLNQDFDDDLLSDTLKLLRRND